jgi:DNA-binding NtrC family response regulator
VTSDVMRDRILLVEDDDSFRRVLTEVLGAHDFEVSPCPDAYCALETLQGEPVDVVVTDVDMPGMRGDALLAQIRSTFPEIPVIAITAFGTVEQAVELTHAGAANYLTKPFRTEALLQAVRRVLEQTRARREQVRARREVGKHLEGVIGTSPPMLRLFERIGRVGTSPAPVLIRGETGTGKELVARAVHSASGRGPFVPLNCGAIPDHLIESEIFGYRKGAFTGAISDKPGLFEIAHGGTLFLDEIAELPLALQPKLLRALESGEVRRVGDIVVRHVEVRIIAATHRDLEAAVQAREFREDLYWRIHVLSLDIPALRERRTDIPLLVEHFLSRTGRCDAGASRVSPAALAALIQYSWPGNVRQLRGVIERAVAFSDRPEIDLEDLPDKLRNVTQGAQIIRSSAERELSLAELEREYILEVLRRTGNNKAQAAEWLGISRHTLYRRLEEYGIPPEV